MVQRGDRLIYCGGALAALYQTLGGRAIMAGKPHAPIYDLALDAAQSAFDHSLDRARVLAIGDGLATDIAGAAAQALDARFIATGIHGEVFLSQGGALDAGRLDRLAAAGGPAIAFAMPDLVW